MKRIVKKGLLHLAQIVPFSGHFNGNINFGSLLQRKSQNIRGTFFSEKGAVEFCHVTIIGQNHGKGRERFPLFEENTLQKLTELPKSLSPEPYLSLSVPNCDLGQSL